VDGHSARRRQHDRLGRFLLPASLAQAAGPISIFGWVFTGAGAMLLALVFANLGRAPPRTGGPYAYARRAFGDFIGFQTAWGYWIAVWAGNAAIAVAFVGYAAVFWPAAGTHKLLGALVAIALIWVLRFGTGVTTLLYILATVAIMGIIPAGELAQSTSPFADAAAKMFGGGWDKAIALVAMISTFGALNGWIMLQGRVPLAAAQDGMFPAPFARVQGERRTPVFGLVVSSVLVSGLLLMNYTKGLVDAFTFVILLATLTTLVPYAYSAAAQAWLWLVEPEHFSPKHLLRDTFVAVLAFAYSVWAIAGAGDDIVTKGFVLMLAGVPVYIGMRWWQRRGEVAS
jgi:APA family basic amino acid/polyamine antiporter